MAYDGDAFRGPNRSWDKGHRGYELVKWAPTITKKPTNNKEVDEKTNNSYFMSKAWEYGGTESLGQSLYCLFAVDSAYVCEARRR